MNKHNTNAYICSPEDMKMMCTATSFRTAKKREQSKQTPMGEWIYENIYSNAMEFYAAMKLNNPLLYITM